jgi:hypothetical protein
MPAIKFRAIAHNSPDYGQAVALRSGILRQPLAFSFSSEQLQSEAGCHHLGASEAFACERGYQQLTLHARQSAVGFFERLGYSTIGACFVAVTLPHWAIDNMLAPTFP